MPEPRDYKREYRLQKIRLELKKQFPFIEKKPKKVKRYRKPNVTYTEYIAPFNFKGTDIDEPIICSEFGCPNKLTITEVLCGTKCLTHQSKQKIEPSRYVKYHIKQSA